MITTINEWKKINEIYFGKGFEIDALQEIKKLLPNYTVYLNANKQIEILGNNTKYIITFGPILGYRYARLSTYKNNEWLGFIPLEKTNDILNVIEINENNSKNNCIFDKSNVNNIFEKSLEDKLFIGDFDLFSEDEEIIEENNKKYEVYIDYLNKDKNFKVDRISFKTYDEAVQWMTKNLEKFNTDMINYY